MLLSALTSRSCNTKSAMMGDSGEPIGAPNFCLYMFLLKVKKVEFRISETAPRNSFLGMSHLFARYLHFLERISRATSVGILVKSETASKEIRVKLLSM